MSISTLIIGGGLSGLAVAEGMAKSGQTFLLVEARDRFGGRILTEHWGDAAFDLGPAWFWPGQLRTEKLIERLGLQPFAQYAHGALRFEDAQGRVQTGRGFASMEGALRLTGGLGALVQALVQQVPNDSLRLQAEVTALSRTDAGIAATLRSGETVRADRVVLALPPRLAAKIAASPPLPDAALRAVQGVSTWMAGQAKALAVYDRPFWREAGLSGDATSRMGPMVEVHDASPARGGPYGLFGFIGVPPEARVAEEALRAHLVAQLVRLFGPDAAQPLALFLKDWASDPHTATVADHAPLMAHPSYGMPQVLADLRDEGLLFAGTEVAPQFGGYVEGALEAAEAVLAVLAQLKHAHHKYCRRD